MPADPILELCRRHPERCAVSIEHLTAGWRCDLNADRLQPQGSVFKLVTLTAYAEAVRAEVVDPDEPVPRDDWARFWVGQDGGALAAAWHRLGWPTTLSVDQMAGAMIRESDNAAADWLLDRLGRDALARTVAAHLPGACDVPVSVDALFAAFTATPGMPGSGARLAARHTAFDDPGFQAEIAVIDGHLRDPRFVAEARRLRGIALPWEEPPASPPTGFDTDDATMRRLLGGFTPRATTRGVAGLMRRLLDGDGLDPAVVAILRRHLSFRMILPPFAAAFSLHAGKGGSLAPQDVHAWAVCLETRDGRQRLAASTALRDLEPGTVTAEDLAAFVEKVAFVPAFATDVRATLGG